jgi:hypothetical protein
MKRILSILLFFCLIISISAKNNHVIIAKLRGSQVLPFFGYSTIEGITPSVGAEINYEYLPLGIYNWERHWMYPRIGISLLGADLGKKEFGQMIAIYPYIQWQLIRSKHIEFGARIGMGASFFSKTNQINNGAYAGVFFATGLNLQFNINKQSAVILEAGTNHINNGEIVLPNYTMNIMYASLGYRHQLGEDIYKEPNKVKYVDDLKYKFMINNTLAAGIRHSAKNSAIHAKFNYHGDILWKITNCYALGPGIDFGYAPEDIKLGLTLSNAFTMGRISGVIDGGFYLYDSEAINAGYSDFLYYKFNHNTADGKLFLRAGVRYNIIKDFYAQATIRTHLYKFDYIEFGLGYSFKSLASEKSSKRSCKCAKQYR